MIDRNDKNYKKNARDRRKQRHEGNGKHHTSHTGQIENPAKAKYNKEEKQTRTKSRKIEEKHVRKSKKEFVKMQRRNRISRGIGMGIGAMLIIAAVLFMGLLIDVNLLPMTYLLFIGIWLTILSVGVFLGQFLSKKKAILGKIIGIVLSVTLFAGSFYLHKANTLISDITSNDLKIDSMAVVVLAEDEAETLEDAADYDFAVQYALKGDEIVQTVEAMEEELGQTITTTEYESIEEQAKALLSGEIDAMIYNGAFGGVFEETLTEFSTNIKVIYTHEIETIIETTESVVEVAVEPFVVYISGIDVYGAISQNSRSDVNILAVVNPTTHEILLVNTPRDYYVTFPGITGSSKDKLTHAGIYGVDVSMATLAQLYSTEIEFYARVNFTSLINMVDALGGLEVYSQYSFTTTGTTKVSVVAGMNTFDGTQALAFARERHSVTGGDATRGTNQQAIITAMIEKAMSPAVLTGINELIASVSGSVETNMTDTQIQSLVKNQLASLAEWTVESVSVTGTDDSQYCYSYSGSALYVMQPDLNSVAEVSAKIEEVLSGGVEE